MPVLETILLGRRYTLGEKHIHALRGVSVSLDAGETLAVVGPAGSGKTTLLNLIAGLDRPTRGTFYLDGQEMTQVPRWQLHRVRARQVGFLPRRLALLPERTVLENVAWPLRYLREGSRGGRERALRLLARVGLAGREGDLPAALSPAEQQRMAVARAFINRPLLVAADEPAADLPPEERRAIIALLGEMAREEQAALVLALQDGALAPFAGQTLTLPEEGVEPLAAPGCAPGADPLSPAELAGDIYAAELRPLTRPLAPLFNFIIRPALYTLAVAVVITFLCFFGLELAARGQAELPPEVWRTAGRSFSETARYLSRALSGDLGTIRQYGYYYWAEPKTVFVRDVVLDGVRRSLPLLGFSLLLAALIGAPLGIGAALARRSRYSLGFIALAVAGVSIPSFFLAFLLQLGEIRFYRATGIQLVPLGGFGWDRHMILPALVLAARPIAQVARVSFVALSEVLDADYIRTARAKGLHSVAILLRHALKNASVPILTALGTSLRFALSSLPVVETIFSWPGLGQRLLTAMLYHQMELAAGLTLVLGLFFTVVNVLLENINRLVDPRLAGERSGLGPQRRWTDVFDALWQNVLDLPLRLQRIWRNAFRTGKPPQPYASPEAPFYRRLVAGPSWLSWRRALELAQGFTPEERARDAAIRRERRRAWARNTIGSLPFTLGAVIILAIVAVCVFGPSLAPHDPFDTRERMEVNGQMVSPPFPPSAEFPLGTDQQGRDILSLLLVGARRTMTIAFFAVLARVLLGALLGCLAGWFAGSLLDRALMSAVEVLAAFPALLLSMVIIFALGVKQGMWVFVAGLCIVGWGEAAQFVRGQVMAIREKEYVEGALAVGLGDMQVLLRQALPNLFPSLVVLAFLEMGGAMMLLGELGFIGIFIGGGVRTRNVMDQAITYFDVPEWGVMLSNTWRTFRTHPWATLYPALAFTVTIVGFNFFGEGLRRLTERLTVNLNRVFNRYTVGAAAAVAVLGVVAAEGAGPWGRYEAMVGGYDTSRAMAHVQALAGPEMEGRRSGTPGLDLAADYIAGEFKSYGLLPAGAEAKGGSYTYFQTVGQDYYDLAGPAQLSLRMPDGSELGPLAYGTDYLEWTGDHLQLGTASGELVFAAAGARGAASYGLAQPAWAAPAAGRVVMTESLDEVARYRHARAVLLIVPAEQLAQRHLQGGSLASLESLDVPYLYISEETAERILQVRGYSLAELRERQQELGTNDGFTLATGLQATVSVEADVRYGVPTRQVLAMFPGTDDELDEEAIFVVAHYDGLGCWPDGVCIPGANDNASGVAAMLEAARLLKESGFRPKRTVFFVAWAAAERRQELDLTAMLAGRVGFLDVYRIASVVEVRGVGAGSGSGLVLDQASSGRTTDTFREAARRSGVSVSTRGHGLHSSAIYPGYGANFIPLPGRVRLPYVAISWDGADAGEHLAGDTVENIDPQKLEQSGRVLALALMRMAGEAKY